MNKKNLESIVRAAHQAGLVVDTSEVRTPHPTVNAYDLADFYSAMLAGLPDDGGSAFPVNLPDDIFHNVVLEHANPAIYGMSLRDWFATHAPEEVPGWFNHDHPPGRPGGRPNWADLDVTRGLRERAKQWFNDRSYDPDPDFKDYAERLYAYENAMDDWIIKDDMARIAQWRYFYADAMLAARKGGA